MKAAFFTTVFLLLFQKSSISQKIEFKCFVKSVCRDTIMLLEKYSLKGSDTTYYSQNGTCWINKLGDYTFYSENVSMDVEPPIFKITSFQAQFFAYVQDYSLSPIIIVSARGKGNRRTLSNCDWLYCGKLADGHRFDCYVNGQKRVEGDFKKGKPIGELKWYNELGKLKYVEYYNKRGKKLKIEHKN